MKSTKSIPYILEEIREGKEKGYKAIIPSAGNAVVLGKSLKEIETGVRYAYKYEHAKVETGVKQGSAVSGIRG